MKGLAPSRRFSSFWNRRVLCVRRCCKGEGGMILIMSMSSFENQVSLDFGELKISSNRGVFPTYLDIRNGVFEEFSKVWQRKLGLFHFQSISSLVFLTIIYILYHSSFHLFFHTTQLLNSIHSSTTVGGSRAPPPLPPSTSILNSSTLQPLQLSSRSQFQSWPTPS